MRHDMTKGSGQSGSQCQRPRDQNHQGPRHEPRRADSGVTIYATKSESVLPIVGTDIPFHLLSQ